MKRELRDVAQRTKALQHFFRDFRRHSHGNEIISNELHEIYFRFMETEDEFFDYAVTPIPPQARWRIDGLGLDESISRKIYRDNAVRLLGIT